MCQLQGTLASFNPPTESVTRLKLRCWRLLTTSLRPRAISRRPFFCLWTSPLLSIVSVTWFYSTDSFMTSAFVVPLSAGCDPLCPAGSSPSPSVPSSLRLPTARLASHRAVCWDRCCFRCTSHQSATSSRHTACLIINTSAGLTHKRTKRALRAPSC